MLRMMELWDKRQSEVRTYSGGMKRRLELARGLLHHPKVLFLDEPTLGLDPQTRNRIWEYILETRQREGTTIFLTTHYMDEAEKADRIAIIDYGKLVAMDTPERLKHLVGKDIIAVKTDDDDKAAEEIKLRYQIEARRDSNGVTFEVTSGEEFLPIFIREFDTRILGVSLRHPSLDDVFLKLTGREIREEEVSDVFKATVRQHGRRMRH
jgi:ABC-2 type transport system ATP-binding protein